MERTCRTVFLFKSWDYPGGAIYDLSTVRHMENQTSFILDGRPPHSEV
jgi:hypothetical protein